MLIENPVSWPNGARCAAAVTFDLDADSILHIARPETADTYVSTQSLLRYGAVISIPRICRVFRDLGLRQTFFESTGDGPFPLWPLDPEGDLVTFDEVLDEWERFLKA